MLVINAHIHIPLREFKFTFARSSGPGGQNVNKVSSKAILRWPLLTSPSLPDDVRKRLIARHRRQITASGDLTITSQRFRDAGRNTADCLEKLRHMLTEAAQPPKRRRPTKPTRGSVQRRLQAKQQQSQKKRRRRSTDD